MKFQRIHIHYIVRLIIFWLLYFALFRMLFIVYHHAKILNGKHSETGLSFLYGLRLDLSTASIAILIPYILWLFQQFYKNRLIHLINLFYNCGLIVLVSALSIINLKIYGEWGTLLGTRALKYFLYPDEMHSFISLWSVLLLIFATSVFAYFGIRMYRRWVTNFSYPIENHKIRFTVILLIPAFIIIGFRGGLQNIPINESNSDYSDSPINNVIATNNIWYLAHTYWDNTKDEDFNDLRNATLNKDSQ